MAMKFGILVPQGWRMDLVGITSHVEAYETMTRVAVEADMPDSRELTPLRMFAEACFGR